MLTFVTPLPLGEAGVRWVFEKLSTINASPLGSVISAVVVLVLLSNFMFSIFPENDESALVMLAIPMNESFHGASLK